MRAKTCWVAALGRDYAMEQILIGSIGAKSDSKRLLLIAF